MKYWICIYNDNTSVKLYLTKTMYNLYYGEGERFWRITKVLRSNCYYALHKNIYCMVI